ncbi:putative PPE family protein PPE38 [Mycobacterium lacus]|uniref:Putative PPE family protein PPE38 n=2 Tax=Mycobacterium lacus TaxID=169765 RepID=A0A7I7NIN5_9MYCO|nr:PPE family protein [Mycobacterium lacus]BBX95367.1 putative PPE family protein PPE38 [Mycobacterium lacus]
MDFAWLPPEINSALIFGGAGSRPLHVAAAGWDGLATDLAASASSFDSVISGLTSGPVGSWAGPASVAMAAAAAPYVGWLRAAASQAALAAGQARAAATAFETALVATVHPAAVTANRVSLVSLIATNFLGQNTPAIAATEFEYIEMWAQDVAAMLGYQATMTSVASLLTPFSAPPSGLTGLATQVASMAQTAAPQVLSAVQSLPVGTAVDAAQKMASPLGMAMSPLMSMLTSGMRTGATSGTGLAGGAAAEGAAKFVGGAGNPAIKGLGGGAGLGAASAGLGQARMVGSMSVPPTWQGSMPKAMASSAMSGLGAMNPAAMAQAAGAGGMPMMPMPMGMGGAGAGMPAGMMGRGGANPHVVQARPSVIPRTGVG